MSWSSLVLSSLVLSSLVLSSWYRSAPKCGKQRNNGDKAEDGDKDDDEPRR